MPKAKTMIIAVLLVIGHTAPAADWSLEGIQQSLFGAAAPPQPEYLAATTPAQTPRPTDGVPADPAAGLDFSDETPGAAPKNLTPVVGNWLVGQDGANPVLAVDGRAWSRGQPAAGIADRARGLYGERYAEFLDNVKAYAYFPYAVVNGVEDFRAGTISVRFKGVAGRIDQAAGILFDLKPNGDYYAVRANPLENNLVLWQFKHGKRSSVQWVKDTPTPSGKWHRLEVEVRGQTVVASLDGKAYLTQDLQEPVSGRVGLWSKADSVVYFDALRVTPEGAQP
jgi:hypothetical protein